MVYLESEIFSSTGKRGIFYYTQIYDYGHYVYRDRYHFRAEWTNHKLSDSRKVCLVEYRGGVYSEDGVRLFGDYEYDETANEFIWINISI